MKLNSFFEQLAPGERLGELLFGSIMALTVLGLVLVLIAILLGG